ncbi:MAG TPA: hypothetical protein VMU99_06665 [Acidimicrobiales bacterium]|nr:hypothetical protein [Acidimicrobiales bacterium]
MISHDAVGPVISGVRGADQLRANARAAQAKLTPDEVAEINMITSTGEEVRADDPFGQTGARPPTTT